MWVGAKAHALWVGTSWLSHDPIMGGEGGPKVGARDLAPWGQPNQKFKFFSNLNSINNAIKFKVTSEKGFF